MKIDEYEIITVINDAIISQRDHLCSLILKVVWFWDLFKKEKEIAMTRGIIEGFERSIEIIRAIEIQKGKEEEHQNALREMMKRRAEKRSSALDPTI